MSKNLIGIVVAGGQSRRMQPLGDKLLLPRDPSESTILSHVIRTVAQVTSSVFIASSSETSKYVSTHDLPSCVPIEWVFDKAPHEGPLAAVAGILAGANQSALADFLLVAGDLPGLTVSVLEQCKDRLAGSTADVAAVQRDHRVQPLLACYRAKCGQAFVAAAAARESRLMRILDQLNVDAFTVNRNTPEWAIRPVHTPEDYEAWLAWRDTFETS